MPLMSGGWRWCSPGCGTSGIECWAYAQSTLGFPGASRTASVGLTPKVHWVLQAGIGARSNGQCTWLRECPPTGLGPDLPLDFATPGAQPVRSCQRSLTTGMFGMVAFALGRR